MAKGQKIRGTFKEEEKYRGESMIMVSVSGVRAESSAGLLAGGGRSALRSTYVSLCRYVLCSLVSI